MVEDGDGENALCSDSYSCSYSYHPPTRNWRKRSDGWRDLRETDIGKNAKINGCNEVRERGIVDAAFGRERR